MIPSFPGAPARPEFPPVEDALIEAIERIFRQIIDEALRLEQEHTDES